MKALTTEEALYGIEQYRKELLQFIKETTSITNLRWLYIAMRCCEEYMPNKNAQHIQSHQH